MDAAQSLAERLPPGCVSTHHGELVGHAHDRWALALLREARGDRVPPPVALVFPTRGEDVVATLEWAQETGTAVVPRGAGTGIRGGAQALRHSVVMDLSRMDRILDVDEVSRTVRVQAGARGGNVEDALAARGLTTGHYPESLLVSTVGGWIASAGAGHGAAGFGAIEDLVLGLTVALPNRGMVHLDPVPRWGAGPDLRRLFVGSEGALGVLVEATLAVSRLPTDLGWEVFATRSFDAGLGFLREVVQRRSRLLTLRLLDTTEAAATFAPFGHGREPILVLGMDATLPGMEEERGELRRVGREFGARPLSPVLGEYCWEHRHDGMGWYHSVMGPERSSGPGVVADLLDVTALWRRVPRVYEEVRGRLLRHAETVGCRITSAYPTGASLLFTMVVRGSDDREVEEVYLRTWRDAALAAADAGASIAHNHGLGLLAADLLERELGDAGLQSLRAVKEALDPRGILNPGKLLPGTYDGPS